MRQDAYYGHDSQCFGVEEHRLVGGRGDGLRLLEVRNGLGLEFTVSVDRGCDISRLTCGGLNYGFFSANGYVGPAYYDDRGNGWLKGFTAGFLTTCGLSNVGTPCEDEGVSYGLHGEISHMPAERISWDCDSSWITIQGIVNCSRVFTSKLRLRRTIRCSLRENRIELIDTVENNGGSAEPFLLLYHFNLGYPLLQESSEVYIPSDSVVPRDARAAEGLETWQEILAPTPGFQEQCYLHQFHGQAQAGVFNPQCSRGVMLSYDSGQLPFFTQWKLMGVRDYVLGMEPANCHVMGRSAMREEHGLQMLQPGASATFSIGLEMACSPAQWEALKRR